MLVTPFLFELGLRDKIEFTYFFRIQFNPLNPNSAEKGIHQNLIGYVML